MDNYLVSVIKQFEYYKSLGDKTFEQLTFEELPRLVGRCIRDSSSTFLFFGIRQMRFPFRGSSLCFSPGRRPGPFAFVCSFQ